MVDNTPMKIVTRSISHSNPDAHTVPTFDLGISQSEEEDALPSKEVRGIGHKRKVRDDVSTPDNDDEDFVKEGGYKTLKCKVFELDVIKGELKEEIKNLGESAIIVGRNRASSVDTSMFTVVKPNHIYFADDCEKHCIFVPKIHFYLVENGKYKDYPWGKKAFKDLVKSISKKIDAQKQYYKIHDTPLATGQNKGKKKIDNASSPPHKKQKQVKSVPSSSNIPSRSSLRNTKSPPISVSKASKRSLSPVAEHQTKKVVTQNTVPQRTLPK
ncbi:hypothetical protein T459_24916 [Capsicum annuum]|uniref:KIB1-4 beta-propeller domain-containing protein n=1 Tax=Capsicum annuum TaxID=4072 RepID=A0A2G2YJ79_CAPAN|nr:hypothetical protein T459_24916 [Capsicum annuum]